MTEPGANYDLNVKVDNFAMPRGKMSPLRSLWKMKGGTFWRRGHLTVALTTCRLTKNIYKI